MVLKLIQINSHVKFQCSLPQNCCRSLILSQAQCCYLFSNMLRKRCGSCENCLRRENCGLCDVCFDQERFGGESKLQKCRLRRCLNKKSSKKSKKKEKSLKHKPSRVNEVTQFYFTTVSIFLFSTMVYHSEV